MRTALESTRKLETGAKCSAVLVQLHDMVAKRAVVAEKRFMPVIPFALAAFVPVGLLALGGLWGGVWVWLALVYISVIAFVLDEGGVRITPAADPEGVVFWANSVSVVLALGHFYLLALGVFAITGATGLSITERVVAFLGFGLFFGQISIANAHDLIHRTQRGLFDLGKWVFISMLYGHVTTSHRLLHHPYVATPKDPTFPPKGTSFYQYLPRSLWRNLVEGFQIERARAARSGQMNPYVTYVSGALGGIVLAWLALGNSGVAALLGFGLYAQFQHAMVDYLQHYGLARRLLPDGRYAPLQACHSWNSPHWFSALMTVNVTRHSDHHAHPGRVYPALRLEPDMPMLPYSLPAMGVIALLPSLWFKVMDRRVDRVLAKYDGVRE
jgi:alkane 1-monooxygenase